MFKGKTDSGFEFEIPEERFNDMQVMDLLRDMQEAEDAENGGAEVIFAVSGLASLLLGKKGKRKLYDHLRTDAGNVPVDDVIKEVMSIFEVAKQGN